MTPDQTQRFNEMENNIEIINGKLDEVLAAIKGDGLGNKGLVRRIEVLEEFVINTTADRGKTSVYIKIISWLAGVIAALVITYMFSTAYRSQPTQFNNTTQQPIK